MYYQFQWLVLGDDSNYIQSKFPGVCFVFISWGWWFMWATDNYFFLSLHYLIRSFNESMKSIFILKWTLFIISNVPSHFKLLLFVDVTFRLFIHNFTFFCDRFSSWKRETSKKPITMHLNHLFKYVITSVFGCKINMLGINID